MNWKLRMACLTMSIMVVWLGTAGWMGYGGGINNEHIASAEEARVLKEPVKLTYPSASIDLPLGSRMVLGNKLTMSAPVALSYQVGNAAVAKVNAKGVIMPLKVGSTVLTIDVAAEGYSGQLKLPIHVTAYKPVKRAFQPTLSDRKLTVSGKTFTVRTVTIPKGMPVTAGLAERRVGATAYLSSIAAAYQADVAINGTFFEAYGGPPDPYGTVISDGMAEHIGNTGTTIGFQWDGSVLMDTLRLLIDGKTAGKTGSVSWYAYFMNRTPAAGATTATLFTPKRGERIGFAASKAVVVSKGVVTRIAAGENVVIPKDGFVLVFQGKEQGQAARFQIGSVVSYVLKMTNMDGKKVDWSQVHTAIGAGPRLVKDGKVTLNAAAEGFKDEKILKSAGARSGIALRKDGSIVLATVSGATMQQWAQLMVSLGAYQAMNLDGGASSGLWFKGKTVTSPGRQLSNALLFGEKLKW
ncbi:phosphodiester glycosidase family protein [Paenibacillus mendelii]|uniref:Phosphodiester glycosidase family protein n=1 Tax=Paenibacillus mendelii TaxID=206163 RepID=A0ABV6J8V6_9BACL|nr:phosphodiester glycosidase family protein [Paenibacillus mendelii]MCQ6559656.1 phosphodiester glycosidase family protein [Paenibacillus mendelii]